MRAQKLSHLVKDEFRVGLARRNELHELRPIESGDDILL